MLVNRVRSQRIQSALSQGDLAAQVGVSRQSIRLIEAGRMVPSTLVALRLAKVLGTTVEALFQDGERDDFLAVAADEDLLVDDCVVLTQGEERPVAHRYPLTGGAGAAVRLLGTVTAIVDETTVRVRTSPYRATNYGIAVAGCDPALQIFAGDIKDSGRPVFWRNADNARALSLLQAGHVQAAAIHTPVGGDNFHEERSLGFPVARIHFATWQMGWLVPRENPLGFHGAKDLASGGFRLVNRRRGAGARALLDQSLADAGVDARSVPQYGWEADSHYQVGLAVQSGAADVGLAISTVAGPLGLDFLPILEENCRLWIPEESIRLSGIEQIARHLSDDSFRWDLAAYGGYDVSRTGELL